NGQTTTNSCQGTGCTITISNSGEGVQKCTPNQECGFSGGVFPPPPNPPGSYCSDFTTPCASPDLSIDKTADAASVFNGSNIGFTITVSNSGTGAATGVSLSDTLPGGPDVNWFIDSDSTDS